MADKNDADTPDESREERLRRNTSDDPQGKTHEDEHNPMHADSWAGGSIVNEAKKIARGEAPRDRPGGSPTSPDPEKPATPSELTRPWSPEPTAANTSGSSEGVDYSGKPSDDGADKEVEAKQAPPTISPNEESGDDRPEITKRA